MLNYCILVSIIVSLIAYFYNGSLVQLWHKFSYPEEKTILAIGILSSRENADQREAARSTWLKEYASNTNSTKAWFIVGNSSCDIPPDYRLSIYGCEKWNINISGLQEKFYTSKGMDYRYCSADSERIFSQGFSFKVNYPVVVTKLGIFSRIMMKKSQTKVAIMDIQNKEIAVQAVISDNQSTTQGYTYFEVDPILLPKNYEGLVLVEGYFQDTACADIVWNNGSGVITFQRNYFSPLHLDSKRYSSDTFSAASIMFYVPEIETLKQIAEKEALVTNQWHLHLEEINKKLRTEMEVNNDILVVNVVDTYRNLPSKLLKFYQWLNMNYDFSYILKTDDDSVLNIPLLMKELRNYSKFDAKRFWLWSRFRKDWPVNYMGKWTDYDYQSSNYPSFPCGAAYVMSRQVVQWLILNAETLHVYQGEDVSIGIWLSAVNPELIEDENFVCDTGCSSKSYNQAQVSLNKVNEVWTNFKNCNNFCTCNL